MHILRGSRVDKTYTMKEIDDTESIELFSWHEFKQVSPIEDFIQISRNVVEYCGRLPLALEVLGRYLFGRKVTEWKCVLEKLKRIPNNKVQSKLKISYDGLDDDFHVKFVESEFPFSSRHVKFVESEFPFSSLATQTQALAPDLTLASPNQNKLTQIIQHPATPNELAHITHPSAPSSPMPNDLAHTTQQQSPSSQTTSELAEPTQTSSHSSPNFIEVAQNIQISSPTSPTSNELANIITSPTPPPPPPPTARPHSNQSTNAGGIITRSQNNIVTHQKV